MDGPLQGIRVLDLGHDWACPHAARLLADFGADVIKVEYPKRLDGMRGGYKKDGAYNRHPRFWQLHRNKSSLMLDLKREQDLAAFKDLIKISDVLIDNSRVGVMDRLGLGYEVLRGLKKDLIVVSMTAFGQTGPWATYAGYGATIEALSGIQAMTAYAAGETPYRLREMDVTNGIVGTCAVMTGLMHRQQTGEGQFIDLSEFEAASHALLGEHLMEFMANGNTTLPVGNRRPDAAPHGVYRCAGEDAWVVIAVRSDGEWSRLCEALGHEEWKEDPRFRKAEDRRRHQDALDALIGAHVSGLTDTEVVRILQASGVPSGAVLDAGRLVADPHLAARNWFVEAADGSARLPGMPFRLSGGGGEIRHRGPDLGRDNVRIRCRVLGRPEDEIEPLIEDSLGTAFEVE